jgi:hypothetical protein
MYLDAKSLLRAAVLLSSVGLWAQGVHHSGDSDLLARLSYDGSALGIQRICVAVSRDGDYRIIRLSSFQKQQLQGKIPKEQFEQLKTLLESGEFRALSSDPVGLIRQETEVFTAEIPSGSRGDDRIKRVRWVNADGERPFPSPVSRVVGWLKDFEPKDGKRFEYAEFPDVCPTGELRRLRPPVASNLRP